MEEELFFGDESWKEHLSAPAPALPPTDTSSGSVTGSISLTATEQVCHVLLC